MHQKILRVKREDMCPLLVFQKLFVLINFRWLFCHKKDKEIEKTSTSGLLEDYKFCISISLFWDHDMVKLKEIP